jgi:hypothetical protein
MKGLEGGAEVIQGWHPEAKLEVIRMNNADELSDPLMLDIGLTH